MKYIVLVIALFCTFVLPFSVVRAENFPDGADLFIEAARYQIGNHTLVHSLAYLTEQTYRMPTLSREEIEEKIEKRIAEDRAILREFIEKSPPEGKHIWQDVFDKVPEHVRKQYTQSFILSRFTVKYKAPSFLRKLMSLQVERQRGEPPRWELEINIIEANVTGEKSASEGAQALSHSRDVRVNDTQSYMETFLNFGRLQGQSVLPMHFLLFQDTDIEKYEFSETNIVKFKAEREKYLQEGRIKGLITVGTATYDGNTKAYIVESSADGKVLERYWIDVSRGFICPLVQYYDANGKLLSEYKSENYFLHEKSGLWFPQLYKEMTTDRDGKQEFKEYHIDPSSLDVNFPIADDEFLIEIPEGAEVIDDRRGKGSKRYKAMDNGVLSLGKDGLDLENMNWLASMEVSYNPRVKYVFIRGLCGIVGVLLILLGIYLWLRRKV